MSLRTDPATLDALLHDPAAFDTATLDGALDISGEHAPLLRVLAAIDNEHGGEQRGAP